MATNRGRHRHRRPRRQQDSDVGLENYVMENREVLEIDPALSWLASTMWPRSLTLPITTRGIGMIVCSLAERLSMYDTIDSSSDEDEIIIPTPDIYALYRVFLGLLEYKLWHIKIHPPADVYQYVANANMSHDVSSIAVPRLIQSLINAVGIIEHNEITYIPAVAKDVTDDQGPVPRPENLLLSNLRRAVDLLSDSNTPLKHRKYFYDHNPIPGVQWNKEDYLLLNADEIIKVDYHDNTSSFGTDMSNIWSYLYSIQRYFGKNRELACKKIDFTRTTGEKSLLLSNKMETLRVPDRKTGQELSRYCKGCYVQGKLNDYYAFSHLTGHNIYYGKFGLLGEYPESDTCTDPVYKLRSKTTAGFRVHGYGFNMYRMDRTDHRTCGNTTPCELKLSVTTRGIGINICHLINTSSRYKELQKPNIYALYRLCLGLLAVKLNPYTWTSSGYEMRYITKFLRVPKQIQLLINTVGKFEHENITYVPAVNKDVSVPRPENLLLSNLRTAVELLSNPSTPVEQRKYFYDHNAIPGAQWNREYLLLNPDEIIQANYSKNLTSNFQSDVEEIQAYFDSMYRYAVHMPEFICGPIDFTSCGEKSLLISNEIGTLRVPDRGTEEDLSTYCKRCLPEGNIKHYHALSRMSGYEILLGTTGLFGEYPEPQSSTDPIYDLRSEAVARFKVYASYNQAAHMLNRIKLT